MTGKSLIAASCLVMIGAVFLTSCGGSTAETNTTQAEIDESLKTAQEGADAASAAKSSDDEAANVTKAEAIVKDQFFPDQVDHSGSAKYQREWYMVKGAVQQAGYPCAAVAYVQQTMDSTFKAVCKVALHTNKFDAFIIDPNAETVVPYR